MKNYITVSLTILFFITLYLTTFQHYLLFHSLVELFSIIIACSVFTIALNSIQYSQMPYITYLGISYLFIGILDLFHTLSYRGMGIFTDYRSYATELWIAARYIESICILLFIFISSKNMYRKSMIIMVVLSIVTVFILYSIFIWKIFPICFIEGIGLTKFKIFSEYFICAILFSALIAVNKTKDKFDKKVFTYLQLSIIFTICSELSFTLYLSSYGHSNLVGHYFKIVSFIMIYKAIIETGIKRPFDIMFRELKESNNTKDKLFSVLAHDLKSPFNILTNLTDLLHRNFDTFTDNEKKEMIHHLHSSSVKTYELLENLLMWSLLQRGMVHINLTHVNLKELINKNLQLIDELAKKKSLTLISNLPADCTVWSDLSMSDTVIRNILSNAVKFSRTGESIIIDSKTDNKYTVLTIRDSGIGIDDNRLKTLFTYKEIISTPGTNGETGTGLGLSICKDFMNNVNGKIIINSKSGAGTSVHLYFTTTN